MKFTFYGHACFEIILNGKKILFDPFITPNELAKDIDTADIVADYIFVSHGHADHIADCVAMAQNTGAKVVSNAEVVEWLNEKGLTNTHPMNTGGIWDFGDFKVRAVVAQHSSGLPDGRYGGNPLGFVFYANEKTFYYSGDTALTYDMKLIPAWGKVDVAILPIGDNFTMGAADAAVVAEWVEVKEVVGVHYDTFGYIKIDHAKAMETFAAKGITLRLLSIGESVEL